MKIKILLALIFWAKWGYSQEKAPGFLEICYADSSHSHAPTAVNLNSYEKLRYPAKSIIEVDYSGFSSEAKTAFQSAVDVWERVLVSRVPIKISATWTSMNANTLATAGTRQVFKNFGSVAQKDVWYTSALANTLAGKDLDEKEVDIVVNVNKNASWSYKTDGTKENFKYDLKTVILHEIGHGLGFTTSFKIAGTNETQVTWGIESLPLVYDVFLVNKAGEFLVDNTKFGNPSTILKTLTTSSETFYKIDFGPFKTDLPKVYAPSPFKGGGSISHLDESKYPKGTINSLMSPNIGAGEINHAPGPAILAILSQMGWPIAGLDGKVITATEPLIEKVKVYPNPSQDRLIVSDEFKGEVYQVYDMKGKLIKSGISNDYIDISKLPAGTYLVKIGKEKGTKIVKN